MFDREVSPSVMLFPGLSCSLSLIRIVTADSHLAADETAIDYHKTAGVTLEAASSAAASVLSINSVTALGLYPVY